MKKIWRFFLAPLNRIWDNLCALCMILFTGRKRYLYNELSQLLDIKNDKKSFDGLISTLLERMREHIALVDFSSRLLRALNFSDDRKHLREVLPLVAQMIKNNAESVKIEQENNMLLNQLVEAEASTGRRIAEFIAELDHNTGFLNMLEEISKYGPNNVTIEPKELQPLLYEVFNRVTQRGLRHILEPDDLKRLTPKKLKDVKIIGEGINIERDKFSLASKGWKYGDSVITEAILRKR